MMNTNVVGYCLDNARDIHVCGYQNNCILFQTESGGKMKKAMIYNNSKGFYFNLKNKRIYL